MQVAQEAFAYSGDVVVRQLFPAPEARIGFDELRWGRLEHIGSPAYWASQAWIWEIEEPDHFRIGKSFEGELLACLLGGYGSKAEVGLAAYYRLESMLRVDPSALRSEAKVLRALSAPFRVNRREVRYRFARQKARYIAASFSRVGAIDRSVPDRELRDSLTGLPGVGPKTASWVVRNWRQSDAVSVLDVHIIRAGRGLGLFPPHWRVQTRYEALERRYLDFARAIGARASILDSVMWMTMRSLPGGFRVTATDAAV
ncbi:MAG: hypothetical protein AAFX81_01800 [Pseudomonadota bacterium]